MSSTEDLLKRYASAHNVDADLVVKVFLEERAHMGSGEAEREQRVDAVTKTISEWVKAHFGEGEQ